MLIYITAGKLLWTDVLQIVIFFFTLLIAWNQSKFRPGLEITHNFETYLGVMTILWEYLCKCCKGQQELHL
jgi:hypothetical protein